MSHTAALMVTRLHSPIPFSPPLSKYFYVPDSLGLFIKYKDSLTQANQTILPSEENVLCPLPGLQPDSSCKSQPEHRLLTNAQKAS